MDVRFLIDVAPDPPPVISAAGIAVLVAIVLGLTTTLIAGFVFLLIRIKRRRRQANQPGASAPSGIANSPK